MSGGTRIAGVDFPEDLTRSIVFVASCCDRFWCETGAVIAACNRRVDGGLELPLKVVQARLGHASIQMTADRYGHLFPRADDGAELAVAEKALLQG